ncbi:MAG: MMPL family transporter, partial [Christensenellales bacterium]
MKRLSEFVVKYRLAIVITAVILVALAIIGTVFIVIDGKINSDMLVYLPEGTDTSNGIEFLKKNFDVEGDAFVVVEGKEYDAELSESISRMKNEIEGITQFVWYGDIESIEKFAELFRLDDKIDADGIKAYLRRPIIDENGAITGYNYVLLVLFSYSPSTKEAFNVHAQIRAELNGRLGRSVEISGMTALADKVMSETMKEIPLYLIFSFVVVLIILLISTDSFFDPIILLVTM